MPFLSKKLQIHDALLLTTTAATEGIGKQYKGPFLYYVRVKGWVGGIAKYLLFLTGVDGWFCITLL